MREYAQRFHQLEERLTRETAELKTEIRRRLDALEAHSRQEVSALSDRLSGERQERNESSKRSYRELSQLIKSLEKRVTQSNEQFSKELREMRQLTLERQQGLATELTDAIATSQELHRRRLEELRGTAADRFALADLMTELALRTRGDFRMPAEFIDNGGASR